MGNNILWNGLPRMVDPHVVCLTLCLANCKLFERRWHHLMTTRLIGFSSNEKTEVQGLGNSGLLASRGDKIRIQKSLFKGVDSIQS